MKRISLLFISSLLASNSFGEKFDELLKQKKIEATFKKIEYGNTLDGSEHRGKCLNIMLLNTTNNPINVELDNGYHIENLTLENQDMISTDRMIVSLGPNQQKNIPLNAFCIQKNDRSPSIVDSFRFKGNASPAIKELCVWLQKQKLYTHTAQQAIWCLSDNENMEYVYDTHKDTLLENKLVTLLARLSNKPIPERKKYIASAPRVIYYPIEFDGMYSKHISSPTTTGFYILDSADKVISIIMKDDTEQRQGTVKYSYKYRGQYPKGTYYLKMKQNNTWTLVKELKVEEAG